MSIKEILDHLKSKEGQVIKNAPFSFVGSVLVATVLIFLGIGWIEQWHYGETISRLTAANTLLSEQKSKTEADLTETIGKLKTANDQITNLAASVGANDAQIDSNIAEALRKFTSYKRDPYQLGYRGQDYGWKHEPETALYFFEAAEDLSKKSDFEDAQYWKEFRVCYARDLFLCGHVSEANDQLNTFFSDCTNAIAHPSARLSQLLFINGKLHPNIVQRIENMEDYVHSRKPENLEYIRKFRRRMDENFTN